MGFYVVDGGVVVAVSGVVAFVVGDASGCLAGGEENCYDAEEERIEGDGEGNCNRMVDENCKESIQSRYKRVRFHFVRWLAVG